MPDVVRSRIRLVDLGEWGYQALETVQVDMRRACLVVGGAGWLPVPYSMARGVGEMDAAGVIVGVRVESDVDVADLTWMAAKAYSYALYTGCTDLLKRRATWSGRSRSLGAGAWQTCSAEIGPVRMMVTVRVIDGADIDRIEVT